MESLKLLFWISASLVLYIYIGYPLLIYIIAQCVPQKETKAGALPDCELIIVGYNEAHNLQEKIQSILNSDAIDSVIKIHIASDGSTDETASVLAGFNDPKIMHHPFTERRGKPAVLNELVPQIEAEIVVLTDARQTLSSNAIAKLLSRFADQKTGVVSGELVFCEDEESTAAAKGLNVYWVYEKFIRNAEGKVASVSGATGALYALRKDLFKSIPENTILDDMAIPFQAVFQGARCVFESGAHAYDKASSSAEKESIRKRRTLAGNLQLIGLFPRLLIPFANPIWLQFMSHKALRLISPFLLGLILYIAIALREQSLYQLLLWLQIGFYGLAFLGWLISKTNIKTGLIGAPYMFVALNFSMLLAWWDTLRGNYSAVWDRSDKA